MSAPSFRMFKARGQPGVWFGYAEIDGHTYKIDARHVGEKAAKHFEGTIKRHLKADQQALPLNRPAGHGMVAAGADTPSLRVQVPTGSPAGCPPDFDDALPENM
jgi:hypothetical protein